MHCCIQCGGGNRRKAKQKRFACGEVQHASKAATVGAKQQKGCGEMSHNDHRTR
jgi:hypothetical protein